MIVWLNGAYGVGKTAVAEELLQLLPGSTLYDPAPVEAGLRGLLPKERLAQVDSIHELPSWRRLLVDTAAALLTEVPGPLVTPLSLLRQEHRDEVFGALAARRIPVRHFLLDAAETILRLRIDELAATEGESARAWCLRQLGVYRQARPWLSADAHTVATGDRTPRQSAQAVADALAAGAGRCDIVQTPPPVGETVAAGVLLFDDRDRVLLVDPTYKPGWEFPGGVVERGEAPAHAGVREVAEELGLELPCRPRLLVTDWEPPAPPAFGGLRLLFDGGRLPAGAVENLLLPRAELRGWRLVTEDEAARMLPPARRRRLHWALRARARDRTFYLEAGVPVGEDE
ncbi:NUDIX domain-containing protein [Streptomyces durbertensis]|uniref:NUDIX domain-containing protein n=1 Tax=Streptomyces durbertensis TaxID=2448886 RepID=A0ABR6ED50_9ACTN|nr:NUDIX hydrolase [Streptomyces durbertensis]MBB1243258.1 NUDIX domain-containing protein [Streptomyces durbertensis]